MKYLVLGFQDATRDEGYDAERGADTLKEAKHEARYMLSEEYRKASEASAKLQMVQIWRDGKNGKELVEQFA